MSASSRRAGRWLIGVLLALGLAVLGFMLLRGLPQSPAGPAPEVLPTPSATPQSAGGALIAVPTVDPTLAAIVRPSLPQEWAAAVTDRAAQTLLGADQTARAEASFLEDKGVSGPFTHEGGQLLVGGQAIDPDERLAIGIALADPSEPGGSIRLASIERAEDDTLSLHLSAGGNGSESVRTLSAGLRPGDVLAALVEEAQARGLLFTVSYRETPDERSTLLLTALQAIPEPTQAGLGAAPTRTPTPSLGTSPAPTPTITPSPTLVYQTDIRRAVETGLVPLIRDARHAPELNRQALGYYSQHHAWVGLLAWDANRQQSTVAGRPLNFDPGSARQLTLFGLVSASGSSAPMTAAFVEAVWDGDGTAVTGDDAGQWYYGFRLSEIVHWLMLVAEEQGGQLVVAYDEVGGYRALTVLNFEPLSPLSDN